jgi:hypothetical protein
VATAVKASDPTLLVFIHVLSIFFLIKFNLINSAMAYREAPVFFFLRRIVYGYTSILRPNIYLLHHTLVTSEIHAAIVMNVAILWDIAPRSP